MTKSLVRVNFSKLTINPLMAGHINTTEWRTIIQQQGDWYTGCWWVGCYIWYSEEGPGGGPIQSLPRCTKWYKWYHLKVWVRFPNFPTLTLTITHQRPVYQLHTIWCSTIITFHTKGLINNYKQWLNFFIISFEPVLPANDMSSVTCTS